MELTDNNIEDVKPIASVCPSCKSDNWKTAKMVVLEGSTITSGTIDGKITDPGSLSGGVRNFLLADRWFSLDHKLEAEVELKSTSGLVESVQQLMLAHGTNLQMPSVPATLKRPQSNDFITLTEPTKPSEAPIIPSEPVLPGDKPWYLHFVAEVFISGIVNLLIGLAFPTLAWIIFVISVPVCFVRSFRGNERQKLNYEASVKAYPALVDKTIKDHKLACEKYEADIRTYRLRKQEMDLYQSRVQDVMMRRELLWEHSRVCMRCGTAYVSKP